MIFIFYIFTFCFVASPVTCTVYIYFHRLRFYLCLLRLHFTFLHSTFHLFNQVGAPQAQTLFREP